VKKSNNPPGQFDGVVDYAILHSVLREQNSRIGFVFSKLRSHFKEEVEVQLSTALRIKIQVDVVQYKYLRYDT
jgi:hypothetical protein